MAAIQTQPGNQVNSVQLAVVLSVLLYGCETWTILKSDERKLEAFHDEFYEHTGSITWPMLTQLVRRDGRRLPVISPDVYGHGPLNKDSGGLWYGGLWICSSTTGGETTSAGTTAGC